MPPLPPTSTFPVQLVLDDDTADGSFGVATQTARQFLWFNRFSPAAGFHLEEVWVLFPSGANMAAGGAVQIAIYEDPDGDPTNGATLLAELRHHDPGGRRQHLLDLSAARLAGDPRRQRPAASASCRASS